MTDSPEYAIQVSDLVKSYDGRRRAVDGVSFHVRQGEIYGLLGKNGAGKSTVIKVLTTLIPPTSGSAMVNGLDVRRDAIRIRKRIGVVQQEESFDYATVERNFDIYGMLWEVPRHIIASRKEELIEFFNLTESRKKRAFELSGGQKKRLQVAREFIHDTDVLFLDEPTVGMDPVMRRDVLNFIREKVRGGLSIVFTTQILEEADFVCDRIGIMDKGRMVAEGTSRELKEKFGSMKKLSIGLTDPVPHEIAERISRSIELVGGITSITVTGREMNILGLDLGSNVKAIIDVIGSLDVSIDHISLDMPSLDDVFLEAVKK